MTFCNAMRLSIIACCLCAIFSGHYPPGLAQSPEQQAMIVSNQLAVNAEQIGQINEHLRATDDRVQRQWSQTNANATAISVIQANTDQTKWWLTAIFTLTGGQFVWAVRRDKSAKRASND